MSPTLAPLLDIARRGVPFTATDTQAFIQLPVPSSGGHYIIPVRSPACREWLLHQYYGQYDAPLPSHTVNSVFNYLEALANYNADCQRLPVYRRVGAHGPSFTPGKILLDLANPEREIVEISPTGWRVDATAKGLLQTFRTTLPLPTPVPSPLTPDASLPSPLSLLRSYLNLPSDTDWLRCLAWLLAALRPYGPFPVLILQGPPGSGKSFAARVLRFLIDPSTAPLSPIPASVRDLLVLARHNWVLAFDHVSALSPQLTDALCRLSSGIGVLTRETTGPSTEPLQQYYKCPVILTVTDRWTCPADLADRALILNFPPLSPAVHRTEASLLTSFDQAREAILGALCTAVATALQRTPHLEPPSGRCANALAWAVAASPALECTAEEMQNAFAVPDRPHPIVQAVRALLEQRRQWTGSATQLLELLQPVLSCQSPRGLSQQLKRAALHLADTGIELKFRRLHEGARIIELRDDPGDANSAETPKFASPDFDGHPQATDWEVLNGHK